MARSIEMQNPEVRKLWWITMIVQGSVGITNGLYLFTYGPYFYEKFGGVDDPATAMLLTTVLLGLRQGLAALLEIPTGALADAIGRSHVVILSWAMRVLFFLFLALIWICHTSATSFVWGVMASIAYALFYTMFNGAFSAWCADALRERAPNIQYGWLASQFYSYNMAGLVVAGVISVLLYVNNLAFMGYIIAAVLSFVLMAYCMCSLKETRNLRFVTTRLDMAVVIKRMGEIVARSSQICIRTPVLFWIILTFGSYMFLLTLVMYLWPVYFESHAPGSSNHTRNWILIILVAEGSSVLGSRVLYYLSQFWNKHGGIQQHLSGYRRFFTISVLLSALTTIGFSLETANIIHTQIFFPVAVIVVCLCWGIVITSYESLINIYLPERDSQYRATITSTGSMFRSIMILFLAIPSGGTSGSNSPIYWAIPASILLVSGTLAHYFMKRTDVPEVAVPGVGENA